MSDFIKKIAYGDKIYTIGPDTTNFVDVNDLKDYAKTADVSADISTAINGLSEVYQPIGKYLTEIPEEYAKKSDVSAAVNGLASEEYVNTKVSNLKIDEYAKTADVSAMVANAKSELIGGASSAYDTLKEIEDYINSDGEAAAALNQEIANLKSGKLDSSTKIYFQTPDETVWEYIQDLYIRTDVNPGIYIDNDGSGEVCIGIDPAVVVTHESLNKTLSDYTKSSDVINEVKEWLSQGNGCDELYSWLANNEYLPYTADEWLRYFASVEDVSTLTSELNKTNANVSTNTAKITELETKLDFEPMTLSQYNGLAKKENKLYFIIED